jgi:hypothetical protein
LNPDAVGVLHIYLILILQSRFRLGHGRIEGGESSLRVVFVDAEAKVIESWCWPASGA